jgi:hypothetical protein
MEPLVKARPAVIGAFFASLTGIALAAFFEGYLLLRICAVLAHVSLFLFVLTESFGSVARQRSRAARTMARVFCFMSGFVVLATSPHYE